jgi:hypothetical protein
VDDLIAGECTLSCPLHPYNGWFIHILIDHETMLGLTKTEAGGDLVPHKTKTAKAREKLEEEEEWGGFGS